MAVIRGIGQIPAVQVPSAQPVTSPAANAINQQRAIAAQAQITGGANNISAQSSVQTDRDKSQENRRHQLLGQASQLMVNAPQGPHLEPHHGEGRPQGRLRYPKISRDDKHQKDRKGHKDQGDHQQPDPHGRPHFPGALDDEDLALG